MSEILSQDEICALLSAVAGDGDELLSSETERAIKEEQNSFLHNFGRPLERNQMSEYTKPRRNKRLIDQNIDLLMDVGLDIKVEIGRSKLSFKDVIGMARGTIITLDKYSGQPADILVNNKIVARGEVIVVDNEYGVRVTELIDENQRLINAESGR